MKKLFVFFAAVIVSLSVQAEKFTESVDYKVLNQPHSEQPMVNEFFSFYCPHCYQFEGVLSQLKSHLPAGTEFTKSHVSFMGGGMGEAMSKAYATMVSLGIEEKMIPVMFDQIHVKQAAPQDMEELKQIFVDHGVKAKDFESTFNSFAVDSMSRRFDKDFQDSGLSGVPSVVVNNKYLATPTNLKTMEDYFDLINFLLKK